MKAATLTSPHSILRAPIEDDIPVIVALMTDPAVRRFLGGPASRERALARAASLIAGDERRHSWAVALNSGTPGCIGLVEIHRHHDGLDHEFSYEFLPTAWGSGLASEAVGAVLDHGFGTLGHDRLIAETQAANQPSRRLLERLGMRWERELERFGAMQAIYAMEKSDWCRSGVSS